MPILCLNLHGFALKTEVGRHQPLFGLPLALFIDQRRCGGDEMALTKRELIRELKHQINSPLAAIRNALYLAAVRTDDLEIERYLKLADDEVSRIATVLREADQLDENKSLQLCSKRVNAAGSAA